MTARKINLKGGVRVLAETYGDDEPKVVVVGFTSKGGHYTIRLTLNQWDLGLLAEQIRDHFVKLREVENYRRTNRERALKMPT